MNEETKVDRAKAGDNIALTALIEENYKAVYAYVYRITFDKPLSEDITQDTFTRFICNLNRYEQRAKLSTFLIGIASNILKDHFKKSDIKLRATELSDQPIEPSYQGSEQSRVELKETLLSLPTDTRMIVMLKEYYGYTLSEIAKIMDMPEGTVKSKIHYAVKRLREEGYYE